MENARTLGRESKIAHIMTQRHFFEVLFTKQAHTPDPSGDPSFRYTGHIFPENRRWLKENNIDIYKLRCEDADSDSYGYEVYILTPAEDIQLSEKELTESENKFDKMLKQAANHAMSLMEELIAGLDDDDFGDEEDEEEFDDDHCNCGCCKNSESSSEDDTVPPPYSV